MTNRAGPEVRGVTVRPTPATVSGNDTWFTDCVGGDPTTGTMLEQGWFNGLLAKMRDLFTAAHPTALPVDDAMLTRAVNTIIQAGAQNFAVDSGSADALVATFAPVPFALTNGMRLFLMKGAAANATTGPTLNVNATGALTIFDRRGNALSAGDIPANSLGIYEYVTGSPNSWRYLNVVAADILRGTPYTSRIQYFFASGTFTVPANVTAVEVEVVGAGGAGGGSNNSTAGSTIIGNCGGGGGGGGYCRKKITGLTPGGTVAVTVGNGGAPNGTGNGGAGGSSSFGAFCTANGGTGGAFGSNTIGSGGSGGTATGGDINFAGGVGGSSGTNDAAAASQSEILNIFNKGAMAGGGLCSLVLGGTGSNAQGFGSGGTGASGGSGLAGGAGGPGIVIVRW